MSREPFDINVVMGRVEAAVAPYPKAALFELAERGWVTPFQQAVACIISIRTFDETSLPVADALFHRAATPGAMAELPEPELDGLIVESSFHEQKARWIVGLAELVEQDYDGEVPCDRETLTSFTGIGPKCAALVLSIACRQPSISVDVHVHRVTNRWGYVTTKRPEQTMAALEAQLPERYWVDINRLLVPFGKHICVGRRPHCSRCPVLSMCDQVAVVNPR